MTSCSPHLRAPQKIFPESADIRKNWTEAELTIIWAVTLWYNSIPIRVNGSTYQIGRHKPPALRTLLGCSSDEWNTQYKSAFQKLERNGAFHRIQPGGQQEPPTMFSRKVEWAPSPALLSFASSLYGPWIERLVPESTFNSQKGHIGDFNELLTHRTMVAQTATLFRQEGFSVTTYPERGGARADIHAVKHEPDGEIRAGAEIISDHNDREMLVRKYDAFQEDDHRRYLWVFKNRTAAAKALTYMHAHAECSIANAPYRNPKNYSISRLNKYISDSREAQRYTCPGVAKIQTLTGIYNALDASLHSHHRIPEFDWAFIDNDKLINLSPHDYAST